MSKRKSTTPDDSPATPLTDDERARAIFVLRSQGRAVGCFAALPASLQRRLSELVNEKGQLADCVVTTVRDLFADYYHELKATVEE